MSLKSQAQEADRELARRLLERSLKTKDRKQQDDLLKTLQYSTIALRLAISYIKSTSGKTGQEMKIDQYLKLYKQKESELKIKNDSKCRVILVALKLALDAIKKNQESGLEAEKICLLIAYFALDKPVPWYIFLHFWCDVTRTTIEKILKALELLTTYGIVFFELGDDKVEIDHSIQEVIRAYFKNSEVSTLDKGLELINNQNVEGEEVFHAMALWDHASNHGILVKKYHRLIGNILDALNRYIRDSELLMQFAKEQLRTLEKHLGPHHEEFLKLRRYLFLMMLYTAKSSEKVEARNLFKESLVNRDSDMKMVHSSAKSDVAINQNSDKTLKVSQGILDECKKVPDMMEKLALQTRGHLAVIQYELAKDGPSRVRYANELRKILRHLKDHSRSDSSSDIGLNLEPVMMEATAILMREDLTI